ncbi:hypothetical protein ACFSVK_03400 [Azorhizophilus paspali]|uniref:hypothetical protein n=1 Tax=Azorhizophilus paspali TaxID=69963 RepID=UPI0036440492
MIFLLVAGFPDSLLSFRGPLLEALLAHGLEVHVAAPQLAPGCPCASAWRRAACGCTTFPCGAPA